MSRHHGKLRNKIFLAILVGLVPALIAAALGVYTVIGAHREDVARLEEAVLRQTSQGVSDYINNSVLASPRVVIPSGGNIETATTAQIYALNQILAASPYIESESYINRFGKETAHVDRSHLNGYPLAELRDMSDTPEFRAARAGSYYLGPITAAPRGALATFAAPVMDEQGSVIAVTAGTANLQEVQKIVSSVKIGETGSLYLMDSHGNVIAGEKKPASVEVITSEKTLESYGWTLVAEWPTSEANAVINKLLIQNGIAVGIVILLAFALAFFLGARIARPVAKLREGAARVAQGNLKEGVYINTGDELEDLGSSFNDMVQGLKQLEELKDEFVFIAAHELRTPVAAMKGYLSLILDGTTGAITESTKQYIEKVIASDNRLVQLVNDLLEVARSQAGRLSIKVAPTDLRAPIRSTLDELKSLADEKSVKLVYEPQGDLPKAMADEGRVKEVMVNLVGNAIKYMGGAGTITVSHEVKDEAAGKRLVTHVADTGLGISKEAQAKLFEKFYRVQTEKTRDITGTGLGLFIVREIVEKMGGTISVASEEGKGSTFSFSLPLA